MVQGLIEAYYWNVTRYTTSGFLRLKLGQALARRGVAPHVYESSAEALKHLDEIEEPGSRADPIPPG
jgi:propionate CoA-transferase